MNLTKARIWYITVALVIAIFRVSGQNSYGLSDSYISVSAGASLPLGQSNSTSSSDWSGHANNGYNINLRAGVDVYHSYGVAAVLGYYRNKYKMAEFITNLSKANPATYSGFKAKGYEQKVLLLGLYKTSQFRKNTWWDFRIMGGLMVSDYPNPQWTITTGGSSYVWSVNVLETSEFVFDLGMGARYYLGKRMFAMLDFDFLYANPAYSGTINTEGASSASEILSGRVPLFYLTLNGGIGYQLFKPKPQ